MFGALLNVVSGQRRLRNQAAVYQAMLRREADLGGRLFGETPKGGRREFFCLDRHTWVWHEEWIDEQGNRRHKTTRYDVRPSGVLKAQDGYGYQRLSDTEARNFRSAVDLYHQHVTGRLYGHVAH